MRHKIIAYIVTKHERLSSILWNFRWYQKLVIKTAKEVVDSLDMRGD